VIVARKKDDTPDAAAAARAARKAEAQREWKRNNPDKVKAYQDAFRAKHADRLRAANRERERERYAKARAERERRAAARERARDWYAQNRERHLEYQRQYRAAKRAEDPDAYRAAKNERNKRWNARHREAVAAKAREKHRDNPEVKREQAARYYAAHAEEVKARRRAYYASHREAQLAKQREWRRREKRRLEAGLPPRRIHRVSRADRERHAAAADDFFARSYTTDEIKVIRGDTPTPQRLLAEWKRQSAQHRAAFRHAAAPRPTPDLATEARVAAAAARAQEDARLDAIARAINDQLRGRPRPVASPPGAIDAPLAIPQTTTRGMTR
jgi:hypothetical protein